MKTLLDTLRKSWVLLVQLACWVGVIVGKFAPEPPRTTLTAPPDDALHHFAQFLGTVVLGVLLVACYRWRKRTNAAAWTIATVFLAIVTLVTFFVQKSLLDRWTLQYANHTITIADHLTRDAAIYRSKLGAQGTFDRLLADSGGDASQVWPKAESDRNYRYLSKWMIALWIAAASCIVSVSQALRCVDADGVPPSVQKPTGDALPGPTE